jgi:hypothetical protein
MRTVCEQTVEHAAQPSQRGHLTSHAGQPGESPSEILLTAAEHPLTFGRGCGSMLDAAAPARVRQPDNRRQAPSKPKESAMQIGEQQEEFEILPEEEPPLVLPEREPQQHPEAAPA